MLVLSNNCCAGYLYNHLQQQYNNPFIWCRVSYDDMLYIIENFKDINWKDYEFEKAQLCPNTYNIKIGDIRIHYPHYIFDPNAETPIKDKNFDKSKYDFWMGDVRYCRIWKLIDEKYNTRTNRMLTSSEQPCFIIRDDERFVDNHPRSKKTTIQDIINSKSSYKRIVITSNRNLIGNENCKIIYVRNVAEHPDIHIKEHLTEIRNFFGI